MRRYGKWAGNEAGTAEDPRRCIAEIPIGGGSFRYQQCQRKRNGADELCGWCQVGSA